jgi:hypothetical protein
MPRRRHPDGRGRDAEEVGEIVNRSELVFVQSGAHAAVLVLIVFRWCCRLRSAMAEASSRSPWLLWPMWTSCQSLITVTLSGSIGLWLGSSVAWSSAARSWRSRHVRRSSRMARNVSWSSAGTW